MLSKQTSLNQIEITENGTLQLRFEFKVMDGDEKVSGAWHRAALTPGVDIGNVVTLLNEAFANMNKEPVIQADVTKLQSIADAAWTPEVLQYHAELAAQQAQAAL
jgi:hypothetical protein